MERLKLIGRCIVALGIAAAIPLVCAAELVSTLWQACGGRRYRVMAALLALGLLTGWAAGSTNEPGISVSWTFVTHNTNGTPVTNLAGAKVYYGTSSSNYTHVIDVPGGVPGQSKTFRLAASVHGLLPGVTYYLNGTAYNRAGLESDFCNEVAKSFHILDMPGITISETAAGEVWRRVIEVRDGVFRQRWKLVKQEVE
jgi:hypothetical protein